MAHSSMEGNVFYVPVGGHFVEQESCKLLVWRSLVPKCSKVAKLDMV